VPLEPTKETADVRVLDLPEFFQRGIPRHRISGQRGAYVGVATDAEAVQNARQRMISEEIEIERTPESHADLFSNCETKKPVSLRRRLKRQSLYCWSTKMAAHANADLTEFDFMGIPRDVRVLIYDKAQKMLLEERKGIKQKFRKQIFPWIEMNYYRQNCIEIRGHSTSSEMWFQKNLVQRTAWQVDKKDRLLRVPKNGGPCRLTIFIDDFEYDYATGYNWPTLRGVDYEGVGALSAFSNDDILSSIEIFNIN
jgi:hypothetical protein